MKIALYIEEGLEQLVLTPESDHEKALLGKLGDPSRTMEIKRGAFYETHGNWIRYAVAYHSPYGEDRNDESTMIVLRKPAPTAETK